MTDLALTYPGDVSATILGEVKGPTLHDEYLTAVRASFMFDVADDATSLDQAALGGRTVVGFVYGIRCKICGGLIPTDSIPETSRSKMVKFCNPVRHDECDPA